MSPETLDFGVLDKSCSVRECHLGQWKQWDFWQLRLLNQGQGDRKLGICGRILISYYCGPLDLNFTSMCSVYGDLFTLQYLLMTHS